MQHTRSVRVVAVVVASLMAVATAVATPAEDGAASVADLIDKCKKVEKMSDLAVLIHPDSRPMMGFAALMMGTMAPMMALEGEGAAMSAKAEELAEEFEALTEEFGIKDPPDDAPTGETQEGMAMRARYMFDGVDIAGFVAGVEDWLGRTIGQEALPDAMGNFQSAMEQVSVEDGQTSVTIDGETVMFVEVDGRWYLNMEM